MKKPNIVYLHTHDLGRYCEPMGYDIPAGNLQRLAEQGVLFRNCHAAAPTCGPSRAALVTGQYPHSCGMLGLPSPHLGYRLNDYRLHIGQCMRDLGYTTALSGVQHVARHPMVDPYEVLPYDRFLNHTPDETQIHTRALTIPSAVDFLNEKHDKPFFLSVGLLDPHRDNHGDQRTYIQSIQVQEPADIEKQARYCQPFPHMPDNAITRREMANFKRGVAQLDYDIGRILAALDQPNHRNHTLVIFTTDHGPGVCEMKATLTDRGTGVTTIIRGPSDPAHGDACIFSGGKVQDALCQQIDLYPTLCELAGRPVPEHCQGRSLLPLLRDGKEGIHDEIFTEQTYHLNDAPKPYRSVRTERYRYIRCYKSNLHRGVDPGPAQKWLTEHGYLDRPVPKHQLFDYYYDPHETNNLASDPAYMHVLADLQERLSRWQAETDDPMIDGTIPDPPIKQNRVRGSD